MLGGFLVRNRLSIRFLLPVGASVFLLMATLSTLLAQQPQSNAPGTEQGGGRGARGRGAANPLLSQPAPRLPDGTVNLGRVAGELGIWQLPYIQNMGARNIVVGAPPAAGAGAGRGSPGGQRQRPAAHQRRCFALPCFECREAAKC